MFNKYFYKQFILLSLLLVIYEAYSN